MPSSLKLGYLVFNVRRPDRWADFCHSTLGLPDPVANPDDSQGYQIDDVTQRLIVEAGKADDLAALGLECDREALDGFVARLRTAGVNVETGSPEFGQRRRVAQLHRFADPDGN